MKTLLIDKILYVTDYGATCPVVIKAEDGNKYVLKTQYDGLISDKNIDFIFVELFAYKLLQKSGFKDIPDVVYLKFDDFFLQNAKERFSNSNNKREQSALKNILNSTYLNIGVLWIDDSEKFVDATDYFINTTINYDGYVLNSDRSKENPNILYSITEDKNYLIDFGNSFESTTLFNNEYENNKEIIYSKFSFDKNYLFLDKIDNIKILKQNITQEEISNILNELPNEWIVDKYKKELTDIVFKRMNNKEIFQNEKTI